MKQAEKMDFNSFINKESFKAILLQHLKSQVNAKFGHAISSKIKECSEKEEFTSPDLIIPSVSKDILESEEFPKFSSTFLENVDNLLEDEGKYVPKESKYANNSQCSSASSMNVSSIDFLSPDQFQDIVQSLTRGTHPEKLEALGMLHRLPTLEPISQQCLWSDIEGGLHESLSSSIVFLRDQSLKLYIKMLNCPEPKVVQESYLSLIKYFLEVLLPSLNKNESSYSDYAYKYRSAVQIITILNKFLQSISTHWLRYPQSLIESITMHSLKVLSKNENAFPTWMCVAICDPEAKWLKNIMHGHVSRSALLHGLEKHVGILHFAIDFCDKFSSGDTFLMQEGDCCQKSYLTTEITHMICFLSQLLQYCDGRSILDSIPDGKVSGSWMNVLDIVMSSAHKLCRIACFKCCAVVSDVVSKKWLYIWASNDGSASRDSLIQLLMCSVANRDCVVVNDLFFTMQCLAETVNSTHVPSELCIDTLVEKLLVLFVDIFDDSEGFPTSATHLYNSSLILVKRILLVPCVLFLNPDFMKVFTKWWCKVKQFGAMKMINNSDAVAKVGVKIASEVDQNISDVFMQMLRKPTGVTVCHETSFFEVGLNILLEKILKDINSNNSVCSCDIGILSGALNAGSRMKSVLNKTLVFRLSSIIWQLSESNNERENFQSLKFVLEILLSSIFCDLFSIEMSVDGISSPETLLYYHVLLFPNKSSDFVMQEEYTILSLQIISLLACSIQSLCLLQSKFRITEALLELQQNYITIEENQIIDPVSILLNHILVKLYAVGGPSERNLPVEALEGDDIYAWPFIKEFPISSIFYQDTYQCIDANEISSSTFEGNVDSKDALLSYIQLGKPSFDFILQLLKDSVGAIQTDLEYVGELHLVSLDNANAVLHDEELVGLPIVKRYGKYLALMSDENEGKLEQFLNACKHFIGSEESKSLDVFVCTIFLMCKEDSETAFLLLKNFAKSCYSFFTWQEHLIQASKNSLHTYVALHDVILELCDLIVKQVFPDLFLILQSHGILPSTIYTHWSKQCYWNYLNFEEISHYVLLSLLFSGELSLYFFCAVLKHSHSFILQHSHDQDLYCLLVKNPINDFKISGYISFISTLNSMFHETIYNSLSQYFKGDMSI